MSLRTALRTALRPLLRPHPAAWNALVAADLRIERARHDLARALPVLIRPEPRHLEIAITANCNQRCVGCRYGRDFMPGQQLSLEAVRGILEDARAGGIWDVRFYGGEPLLHRDLPRMVERAHELGIPPYVTTNGTLLERRIDALYAAGLRALNIGFYGTGSHYDAYVQRPGRFDGLERGMHVLRDRYGSDVTVSINWLLMRPSCTVAALHRAWEFCLRHDASMQVDLVHYSLPYFTEGPDRCLQFRPEDRRAITRVVDELLRLKQHDPVRLRPSAAALASIPDWLLRGPDMRVPCDSHQGIWVGADGTVQQCYAAFPLGNVHEQRLRDLLFTPTHRRHARGAHNLECPNCHCHYPGRVEKHTPSLRHYSALARATAKSDSGVREAYRPAFGGRTVRV